MSHDRWQKPSIRGRDKQCSLRMLLRSLRCQGHCGAKACWGVYGWHAQFYCVSKRCLVFFLGQARSSPCWQAHRSFSDVNWKLPRCTWQLVLESEC